MDGGGCAHRVLLPYISLSLISTFLISNCILFNNFRSSGERVRLFFLRVLLF